MAFEPDFEFGDFQIDLKNRELRQNGHPVALNARYFDALVLLVRDHGELIPKDRFFAEIWDNTFVTDAALTQCIKDIRKQLGDDVSHPRYIQTVPRHGYRFIAAVSVPRALPDVCPQISNLPDSEQALEMSSPSTSNSLITDSAAGALGGLMAGLFGGIVYGFALAYTPDDPGMGGVSQMLVLVSLCMLIGGLGGLGVSLGLSAARVYSSGCRIWTTLGGALGGLITGGLIKLIGVDALFMLFGARVSGITGGLEGALLGAAVAFGLGWYGFRETQFYQQCILVSAALSAAAGLMIAALGGRLMIGSLELLTRTVALSQLRLDRLGTYFGEAQFGERTLLILSGFEGFLFGACVAGSILFFRRIKSN